MYRRSSHQSFDNLPPIHTPRLYSYDKNDIPLGQAAFT